MGSRELLEFLCSAIWKRLQNAGFQCRNNSSLACLTPKAKHKVPGKPEESPKEPINKCHSGEGLRAGIWGAQPWLSRLSVSPAMLAHGLEPWGKVKGLMMALPKAPHRLHPSTSEPGTAPPFTFLSPWGCGRHSCSQTF